MNQGLIPTPAYTKADGLDEGGEGGDPVVPGSQTFTSSGDFTVPNYNTLTVTMWGGGSSGNYNRTDPEPTGSANNVSGTASTFSGLSAGGGNGATGGTASGGDTNTDGNSTSSGQEDGADAPGGGGVGGNGVETHIWEGNPSPSPAQNGSAPGGGGGGFAVGLTGDPPNQAQARGGGSGAKVVKTYSPGDLVVGATIAVVVGAGGIKPNSSSGSGARGEVRFVWS